MRAIESTVIDLVKKVTNREEINLETKLERDIGIDSLGIVTLILEIEDKFCINCDDFLNQIRNASQVKDLCNIISIIVENHK